MIKEVLLQNLPTTILTAVLIWVILSLIAMIWSYRLICDVTDNARMDMVYSAPKRHKESAWMGFVMKLTSKFSILIAMIEILTFALLFQF